MAHLPRHLSLRAPVGLSAHSVTEAAPTFEEPNGEGRGCASSRNFRALTPCGRSGTEASPFFQNLFLFSGVETPLAVPPRWLLSLMKAIWGELFKRQVPTPEKKVR